MASSYKYRDSYQTVKMLGKGSFGTVSLALHVPTLRLYAIKNIKCGSSASYDRMKNEVSVMITLCQNCPIQNWPKCTACCYQISEGLWMSNAPDPVVTPVLKLPDRFNTPLIHSDQSVVQENVRNLDAATDIPLCLSTNTKALSPYIVKLYGTYPSPKSHSQDIIMEYMSGGSLQDLMDNGKIFDQNEVLIIAYSVVKVLITLHQKGYVHGDIKPANILVNSQGQLVLADFGTTTQCCGSSSNNSSGTGSGSGSSKSSNSSGRTQMGSTRYMSPESKTENTCKSDIWSLGISLSHLLQGAIPFMDASSYLEVTHSIAHATIDTILPERAAYPAVARAFIRRCTEISPDIRSSALELLDDPYLRGVVISGSGWTNYNAGAQNINHSTSEDLKSVPRLEALSQELFNSMDLDTICTICSLISNKWCEEDGGVDGREPIEAVRLQRSDQLSCLAEQLGIHVSNLCKHLGDSYLPVYSPPILSAV